MSSLRFAAASDTGKVRDHNEDRWRADADAGLYIVSDGMGGAAHGELAAQIVVDVLPTYVETRRTAQGTAARLEDVLTTAIAELSDGLHSRSKAAGVPGAAATVVAALIVEKSCTIAHLGDSRAYLLREDGLVCLTRDHSVAQALVDAGQIEIDELANHPTRNSLTRFMGMPPPAKPAVTHVDLRPGDRILLCSDGVSGAVDAETLRTILRRDDVPEALCKALIDAANDAGGRDNMTALLIDRSQ